jgi:putative nucleotidyltransferase with HDIG domain
MRKVVVSVHECIPGMIMAETIFNEYGAIVVGENAILDDHMIKKLKNLDIMKIKIFDLEQVIISANTSEFFKAQYNENVEVVKDMLHDISIGKNINTEKVNTITQSVFVRINENRDIVSCINQIRSADEYTYAHSVNVSLICMLIGKWLKFDTEKIKILIQAGLLHDIGKGKIPPEILNKPDKLTADEYEEMKKHPVYGYRIAENMPDIPKDVALAILMHHEREDGTGYPMNIKGSQISEMAKIVAVADIYDAMTSDRSYRLKESPFEVFELMENRAFGFLDPIVSRTFLNNIASYYIGDYVKLNTGSVGEIIYINPMHISQPLIRVGDSYIDLTIERKVKINQLI